MPEAQDCPVDIRRENLDSPVAAPLILALNEELSGRYPEAGANHFRLDAGEIADGLGAFLVAYVDGRLLGCGAIRRLDADTGEIGHMYVRPESRATGIGRALLGALEMEGRRLGFRRLVLETGRRQPKALALCLRAGLVRVPPFGEYLSSPLSICMAKSLEAQAERVSIATPRLVLSPLAEDDAQPLFDYRSDLIVQRFQYFEPELLDDARKFIAADSAEMATWLQFGIRLKETAELAGDIGFRRTSADPRQAEIGITVAPGHQHRGIAAEAVRGLLGYLFGTLTLHRAYASVDPRNEPSTKLFERLGLRQEAHLRQSLWFKGEWADDMIFAILATEWENAR
jgi:putative acetyltransferase